MAFSNSILDRGQRSILKTPFQRPSHSRVFYPTFVIDEQLIKKYSKKTPQTRSTDCFTAYQAHKEVFQLEEDFENLEKSDQSETDSSGVRPGKLKNWKNKTDAYVRYREHRVDYKSFHRNPEPQPNTKPRSDIQNLMRLHSWIFSLQKSGKLSSAISFTEIIEGKVVLSEDVLAAKPEDVDLEEARQSCRSTKRAGISEKSEINSTSSVRVPYSEQTRSTEYPRQISLCYCCRRSPNQKRVAFSPVSPPSYKLGQIISRISENRTRTSIEISSHTPTRTQSRTSSRTPPLTPSGSRSEDSVNKTAVTSGSERSLETVPVKQIAPESPAKIDDADVKPIKARVQIDAGVKPKAKVQNLVVQPLSSRKRSRDPRDRGGLDLRKRVVLAQAMRVSANLKKEKKLRRSSSTGTKPSLLKTR
ncbi:hypothetical protein ACHWQZ_G019575 [Mnemiopsis leidyi]